jgi:hypothetical protein
MQCFPNASATEIILVTKIVARPYKKRSNNTEQEKSILWGV